MIKNISKLAELAINAIKVENHNKNEDDKIMCRYHGNILTVEKIPVPFEEQHIVKTDSDGTVEKTIYHAYRTYKVDIGDASQEIKIDLGKISSWDLSSITKIADMGIYRPVRLKTLEEDMKKNPSLLWLVCYIHDIDLNNLAIDSEKIELEMEKMELEKKLEDLNTARHEISIRLQQIINKLENHDLKEPNGKIL